MNSSIPQLGKTGPAYHNIGARHRMLRRREVDRARRIGPSPCGPWLPSARSPRLLQLVLLSDLGSCILVRVNKQ